MVRVSAGSGVVPALARMGAWPRWRPANGAAGVGVGELHAVAGQRIDMRGFDSLLPVTADVGVAEVVEQDQNDIGTGLTLQQPRKEGSTTKSSHSYHRSFHI